MPTPLPKPGSKRPDTNRLFEFSQGSASAGFRGSKVPVLVTGGAGYIGSHAVIALLDAGWEVIVLDDLSTGQRSGVPDDAHFHRGDVADQLLVERLAREHRIGAVLHFAGSVVVSNSVSDPLEYYRNNTAATRTLLSACVAADVRHFVFSSTAAVYGNAERSPIGEDAPLEPINPYGRSKLMSEKMLDDVAHAHSMNYCALRYFNVAGADPEGRAGQSTRGATHLIKVAVEAALGKRDHVSIYGSDYDTADGTGVRDYIHVSDLAAAHVLALEKLIDEPRQSLRLNCGYGKGTSVIEVLDALDRLRGTRVNRKMQDRRPGDPDRLIADPSRLLRTLDWQPRFEAVETMIEHALAWEARIDRRLQVA